MSGMSDRYPRGIMEALRDGAPQGERNDKAFWLAAQCRDAQISRSEAEGIMQEFCARCSPSLPLGEAMTALKHAYETPARAKPQAQGKRHAAKRHDDDVIPWDGEIGRKKVDTTGIGDPDYLADVPAPSGDPVADLLTWLAALFQPDEKVNYVVSSFKDEDGKWKPRGLGVSRTRADIESGIKKYVAKGMQGEAVLRCVLGDWPAEAGVWARINPMDGQGATNANVTRLDHMLVEGDEQSIERQIAIIKSLRLPCSAVVHSGNKSAHAIVRVDAGTDKAVYSERVDALFKALQDAGFAPDVKCRNSSRLSRMPGPSRAGVPQYLISGQCGAESWDAWMAEQEESHFQLSVMTPSDLAVIPPDDSLVGNRFLCRQGSWLLVAQSGIGKSVFAIQAAISFSMGRELFGLKVKQPLKNIIIQAENNAGDMHEAFTGICSELAPTATERQTMNANFKAVHCSRYSGEGFVLYLAHICRLFKPDIVWIDPLLSYIGGEISKMQDTSRFLQNLLQPVIEDYNIGLVVVHHTGKPPKSDEAKYKGHDLAYLGIGSSVMTNWARATSTLLRDGEEDNKFIIEHAKRADRAGCPRQTMIVHSTTGICWLAADGTPSQPQNKGGRPLGGRSLYDDLGLETMPPLAGPQPPTYAADDAPVVQWVGHKLAAAGMPRKPAAVFDLIKRTLKDRFIIFDSQNRLWKGRFYAPDFR